jgi:Na+-transporting methylmalonyl-CoA/oxaloacetate decarboxylase gamma subunit
MSWWRRGKEEDEQMDRMVKHAAELHGVSTSQVVDAVLEEDEDDDYRGGSHKGVWITFIGVGIVFGIGIIFLMRFVNGAVESGPEAKKTIEEARASTKPAPSALPSLTGLKVTFDYPREFDNVSRVRNASGIEQYMLTSANNLTSKVAVVVEELPSGNLEDESGYSWRAMKTAPYQKSVATYRNEPVVMMLKKDGTERTLYWVHRGMVLIISGTDPGGGGSLEQYVNTIVGSLRWFG